MGRAADAIYILRCGILPDGKGIGIIRQVSRLGKPKIIVSQFGQINFLNQPFLVPVNHRPVSCAGNHIQKGSGNLRALRCCQLVKPRNIIICKRHLKGNWIGNLSLPNLRQKHIRLCLSLLFGNRRRTAICSLNSSSSINCPLS